jgi:hypothetical protein
MLVILAAVLLEGVIRIPVRIALQRSGVFTASARLRSRLPGIVRYLPAAIRREDDRASS